MILGHGAIAKALQGRDRDDRLYFCSGVANSQETRAAEFEREANALLAMRKHRHIVYFSSLCVFYSDTLYSRHKRDMEQRVKEQFSSYTIMRLGNIDWAENPHQLIPYIKAKLKAREMLTICDEWRYLLSKDEFLHWVDRIPAFNCEMNVTGERLKVADIVGRYQHSQWTL